MQLSVILELLDSSQGLEKPQIGAQIDVSGIQNQSLLSDRQAIGSSSGNHRGEFVTRSAQPARSDRM